MFDNLFNNTWVILFTIVLGIVVLILISSLSYKLFFKRVYDILFSTVFILLFSPIYIVLIILGAVKMKGNPFFCQLRPGKNGKIFKMIKFRTMTCEKDADGNLLPDEKRLTKYGKLLRSTSLDELPELFNIFLGQMSFVGPRPQLKKDLVFMDDEVKKRHNIRGGLTGLAQVMGRNNITWEKRFEYDLLYVRKYSFFLDLKIIFLTFFKVLKRSDVATDGMSTSMDYGDWLLKEGKITQEEYNKKLEEIKR